MDTIDRKYSDIRSSGKMTNLYMSNMCDIVIVVVNTTALMSLELSKINTITHVCNSQKQDDDNIFTDDIDAAGKRL